MLTSVSARIHGISRIYESWGMDTRAVLAGLRSIVDVVVSKRDIEGVPVSGCTGDHGCNGGVGDGEGRRGTDAAEGGLRRR